MTNLKGDLINDPPTPNPERYIKHGIQIQIYLYRCTSISKLQILFILASLSPDNCFSVQSTTIRLGFSPIFKYFPYFTTIFSISIIYFIEEELGNKEKVIEI